MYNYCIAKTIIAVDIALF